jgi:hypothetical protein
VRLAAAVAIASTVAVLSACSSAPPSPAGWQPVPGTAAAWTNGSGSSLERYTYVKHRYDGTLQDLASREAIDAVLRHRGARFLKSDIFAPCPGVAAVATFSLPKGRVLEDAFAVQNGQAIQVEYERPGDAPKSPAVAQAIQRALCVTAL